MEKYNQALEGKPVLVEYLPNDKSRKWRYACEFIAYSQIAVEHANALMEQEKWHKVRITAK